MTITTRHQKLKQNIRKYPTKAKAMLKSDYSPSYAQSGHIQKTDGWQREKQDILDQYEKEEQRLLKAATKKILSKEQYRTLIDSLDKVRKQIQLLSGGRTGGETLIIQLSEAVAKKNAINTLPK